jgi:hypothetical protein
LYAGRRARVNPAKAHRRHEARKIHIRETPELHRRLRVRCAERDTAGVRAPVARDGGGPREDRLA